MLSRWTPSSDVHNHTGGSIVTGSIFFAPPPTEIGKVLSAQSGVRTSGSAISSRIPLKIIGLFSLLGVVVGSLLGAGFSHSQWVGIVLGGLIGAFLLGYPIARREARRNDCTYVGTHGIARYPVSVLGRAITTAEIFLFSEAVDLQTAFLGRNTGTNFNFQWKNDKGRTIYKLEGGYYGNRKDIDPDAAFHFATAAEEPWTQFRLPHVLADLQRNGSYRFITRRGLTGKQFAVIGPGYLDILTGDKKFHCQAYDIDDILLHLGWIIIRRKDARDRAFNSLDGANGICYLSYGSVSNVKMFLKLLTQVAGVSWRDGG